MRVGFRFLGCNEEEGSGRIWLMTEAQQVNPWMREMLLHHASINISDVQRKKSYLNLQQVQYICCHRLADTLGRGLINRHILWIFHQTNVVLTFGLYENLIRLRISRNLVKFLMGHRWITNATSISRDHIQRLNGALILLQSKPSLSSKLIRVYKFQ